MIQKSPLSTTDGQPGTTDPVKEVLPARQVVAIPVAETPRTAGRKGKLSEDEIRLEEEAFDNALIELEALGKTAAQLAEERAQKERSVRSEIEEPLQTQQQRTHATTPIAYNEGLEIPADVISRLNSDSLSERCLGLSDLARLGGENAFLIIAHAFDEQSEDVRNAAARALFDYQPDRAASFARALREASPDRRRRIGAALATSGLANSAIGNLAGQTREQGYEAFSLLFLMTKAGEVQPLLRAVEDHPSIEVRLTVVKLLALNGQVEIVPSFRRLAVCGVLPSEVRAAVVEAVYELGRQVPRQLSSGAKGYL